MRKLEMVADSLNFKVSVTDDIGKDKCKCYMLSEVSFSVIYIFLQ